MCTETRCFMWKPHSFSYTASSSTNAAIRTVHMDITQVLWALTTKYLHLTRALRGSPESPTLQRVLLFLPSDPEQAGSRPRDEPGLSSRPCWYCLRKAQPCRCSSSLHKEQPSRRAAKKAQAWQQFWPPHYSPAHPWTFVPRALSHAWHSAPRPSAAFPRPGSGPAVLHPDALPSACLARAPQRHAGRTTQTLSFAWIPVVLNGAQAILISAAPKYRNTFIQVKQQQGKLWLIYSRVTPMVTLLLKRTPTSTTTVQVTKKTRLWHDTILIRDCSRAGDLDRLFNIFTSFRQTDVQPCWPFRAHFPLHLMAHDCTTGLYFRTKDGLQCPDHIVLPYEIHGSSKSY